MLTIILILSSIVSSSAQTETRKPVSEKHADKFGLLVVQTYSGRFAPLQTLASDVMHKISRMDKFETAEKGELTKMQVFLDIQIDPEFWKKQKIIYVREESVREALGMQEKHASFLDFFDDKTKENLKEAIAAYLEVALKHGDPIPQNEVIEFTQPVMVEKLKSRQKVITPTYA